MDTLYIRDSANSAWNEVAVATDNITETSESSSTPVTDDSDFTITAGHRYYAFLTMPTTEPLYLITGIEWKNGATVAGNIMAGVDIIDADPPSSSSALLAVLAMEVAQSGTSSVQKNSDVIGVPIRGGSIVGIWVQGNNASATLREETGLSSQNQQKATSYDNSPSAADTTSWTTATARKYLKLYYRGYY